MAATYERINYDDTVNVLRINGGDGDDRFYVDDNSALTTIDGGAGNDTFQVGQIFGADRVVPNVADGDQIATIQTTVGFLSRGVSYATTILGGTGDDVFTVYSNQAPLKLFGEEGNDNFTVRAFVIKGTNQVASSDTLVSGGGGDDHIEYNINAPVSIDGGAGLDTVTVLGTEVSDSFVITKDGVMGAGLNVSYTGVEKLEVDGLEGDDHFYVLSTNPGMVTTIIGGLGNDTFDVGGDVTTPIVALSTEGTIGFINHTVSSADPAFNGVFAPGVPLNVASAQNGGVILSKTKTTLVEDGVNGPAEDTYTMKLAAPAPTDGTVAYLTVSAALASYGDALVGGKSVEISTDVANTSRIRSS